MAQQTAVEWLMENIQKVHKMDWNIVFIQAKAMEKEQIETAYGDGQENGIECQKKLSNGDNCNIITSMQYYNETYNK